MSASFDGPCEAPSYTVSNLTLNGLGLNSSALSDGDNMYELTVVNLNNDTSYTVTLNLSLDGNDATTQSYSSYPYWSEDNNTNQITAGFDFWVTPYNCSIDISVSISDGHGNSATIGNHSLTHTCQPIPVLEFSTYLRDTMGLWSTMYGTEVHNLSEGWDGPLNGTPDPADGGYVYVHSPYSIYGGVFNATAPWVEDWPEAYNMSATVTVDGEVVMNQSYEFQASGDSQWLRFGTHNNMYGRWNYFALSPFACEVVIDVEVTDGENGSLYSDSFEIPGECLDEPVLEFSTYLRDTMGLWST
ncbi:MAG: hypothetical protein VW982_07585, partial [Candidatus Poseidoniales archaeon]